MLQKAKPVLLILLLIALLSAGIWYTQRPEPVPVLISQVETGIVEQTVANTRAGTVKACRRAKLAPNTGGQITHLNVKEGEVVKEGTLLMELWNKDLASEVSLNQAEAQAAIATARATCLQAEVEQREANRLVRLRKSGAASEESIDKAVTAAKARAADCEAANSSALVAAARIDVARARLEKTRLFAPFEGVVAEINGELNEYVTPSPPGIPTLPAIDLIDDSCFYVTAPIDEVDAPKVQLQQAARVSLDAFGEIRFTGKVRRIADYVLDLEKQARTVEVEVKFTNREQIKQLLAGYSADVEIILDVRENTLRIPSEAVLDDSRVFVMNRQDAVLEERQIKTGKSNWDFTEIVSGLKQDEWVVTSVDREGIEDGVAAILDNSETP